MTHKSYIITGPTASGKSDFAHALAHRIRGTIINCDSVQIYRGIENIAASPFATYPAADNIDSIPYRLFSVLPLDTQISVAEYLDMARQEYNAAIAAARVPIFVGGTGYYINALINGISPMPDVSDAARLRAREMVAQDIDMARKLLPDSFTATDPQRIARALEVFLETGHHLTEYQDTPRVGAVIPDAFKILVLPDTQLLRDRIAQRVPQMLVGGAMDEAHAVIKSGWDENRAIGASQLCKFIRGEITKDECIENWINKTNQYAKRQRTWFRTQYKPDLVIDHVPTDLDIDTVIKS